MAEGKAVRKWILGLFLWEPMAVRLALAAAAFPLGVQRGVTALCREGGLPAPSAGVSISMVRMLA